MSGWVWPAAAAVALLAGALASVAFAPLLALCALAVLFAIVAVRPRSAVIALALASPFFDLVVVRVADIADIRLLEVLWPVAALALAWRIKTGSETRFKKPPRHFTIGLGIVVGWFFIAAVASSGGVRPLVEATQTAYLAAIAYLVAGVIAATNLSELRRWLRPWALAMGLILVLSLGGYALGRSPVAQVVATLPHASFEYVRTAPLVQGAGSGYVGISRLGVLNQGPVGTAAMFVSILVVALAVVLAGTSGADAWAAYVLLSSSVLVLLLTYSRAGWALAIAAAGVLILRVDLRRAAIAAAALLVGLMLVASLPGVASRFEDFTNTGEGSYQAHARMWVTALHMVKERPVFGWGPGMYAEKADAMAIGTWMATDISADQPHNWVLEIAAETGAPGVVISVVFVVGLLIMGWRRTRRAPLPVFGVWVATVSFVAMNLTLNTFRTETMWVWFGALVGVSAWYARDSGSDSGEDAPCVS